MKKLLPLLMLLLWPAWASAQIVTPGGGGSVANGTVIGGSCPANQFVNVIGSPTGVPSCAVPPSGTGYPAGTTPQMTGYASANNSEAETLGGDATLTRPSAGNYTLTVTKTNGTAFTGLATATIPLSIGNGGTGQATAPAIGQMLVANSTTTFAPVAISGDATITSAGVLTVTKTNSVAFSALATAPVPLSVANGGHGSGTAPTSAQIPIAQSATAYTPQTISGDATITNAGVITVTKTSGVAFTGLATASIPLSIANGGRGSATAPSVGQIDVASSTTAFTPVTMSGDATITSTGAITVSKIGGITPGGTCGAGLYVNVISASGVPTCANPAASPTFTGTLTFPDGSTWTSTGPTIAAASRMNFNNLTGDVIRIGTGGNGVGGTISANTASASNGALGLMEGMHYNGTNWIADSANNAFIWLGGSGISIGASNLTVGATVPTNAIMTIAPNWVGIGRIPDGSYPLEVEAGDPNGATSVAVYNTNATGTNAYAGFLANGDTGLNRSAQFFHGNSAYTFPDTAVVWSGGSGGIVLDNASGSWNAPISATINGDTIFYGLITPANFTLSQKNDILYSNQFSSCYHSVSGVANGTNASLIGTLNYGQPAAGILVVRSQIPGGVTMKEYSITMLGASTANSQVLLHSQDYGGGAAPFTMNEYAQCGTCNALYVTNTSGVTATIDYSFLQTLGQVTCY